MNGHIAPTDPDFERWLDDRLDTHLGVHAAAPAPGAARYRERGRRFGLTPIRLGVAAGAAVLAVGGGAAYATSLVHGSSVSQASSACSTGPGDSHGDCVSAAAHSTNSASGGHGPSTNGTSSGTNSSGNDTHGDVVSSAAHTCAKGPGDAHGDCVSAIASGGNNSSHSSSSSSTTTQGNGHGDVHGDAVSGRH